MRIFAYPIFWLIDGFWLLIDGYTKHTSKTPLTDDIMREMRRLYPEIAEELIAREGAKRGFADDVRRRRIGWIALWAVSLALAFYFR